MRLQEYFLKPGEIVFSFLNYAVVRNTEKAKGNAPALKNVPIVLYYKE